MPTASVDGGARHTDMLPRTPPSSLLVAVLAAPAEQVSSLESYFTCESIVIIKSTLGARELGKTLMKNKQSVSHGFLISVCVCERRLEVKA